MSVASIEHERLLLADRLEALPAPAWDLPSLCVEWSVRDVLAHLITPFVVRPPALALLIARRRSLSGAMKAVAQRVAAEQSPAQMIGTLRDHASSTFHPPGLPVAAPLTDVIAHSADIRWVVGDPIHDWSTPQRLLPVLTFLVGGRARAGFVPRGRLTGIAFTADDQDWGHGRGVAVTGASLPLLMVMLGRSAALPSLRGPGVSTLQERIRPKLSA